MTNPNKPDAGIQVCTYMQICKHTSMLIYASMQVFKYSHMQVCTCAMIKLYNDAVMQLLQTM